MLGPGRPHQPRGRAPRPGGLAARPGEAAATPRFVGAVAGGERSSPRLCAFLVPGAALSSERSMSFMQAWISLSQAALLGNEDTAAEACPEVVPVHIETAKKSKRPSREVIR